MQSRSPRPAVVRIAAAVALALALVVVAGEVIWVVDTTRLADPEFAVLDFWPYLVIVVALLLALPVSLVDGARRLLRGEPATLQVIGIVFGAGCTAWTGLVLVFQLRSEQPVDVGWLAVTGALALAFFGLAWLPSRGAGRTWLETHRPHRP